MKSKAKHITIENLTKGNIWTLTEADLSHMIIEGKKKDDFIENETHYMNIIRPVFDIIYLNRDDEKKVEELESLNYEIYSSPNNGQNNAIAIRKRRIKKITDLTLENIHHMEACEVLELIENNLGTGWKGLPLAIQDIIEAAFFVDCSVLPEYAMHRKGGIVERRKNDGYEVLELERGGWIEGVFIKEKPKVEKLKFNSGFNSNEDFDKDEDEDDDEDNDKEDFNDVKTKIENDEDENEENESPSLEEIGEIDIIDEEDE